MKIITNTLLIATLFTSSIIASQPCMGTQCLAIFGKPAVKQANFKVMPNATSFKSNIVKESIPIIIEPSYIEPTYQEIVVSEEEISVPQFETTISDTTEEIIIHESFIDTYSEDLPQQIEYLENNVETNIQISTILENEALNTKPYCEEFQGVLSCDITADTSECVCV